MSSIESYFKRLNCESIIRNFTDTLPGTDYRIAELFISCVLSHGEKSATTTYRLDTDSWKVDTWRRHLDDPQQRQPAILALQKDAAEKVKLLEQGSTLQTPEYLALKAFLEGDATIENCQQLAPFLGPITQDNDSLLKVSEFVASKLEEYPSLLTFAFEQLSSDTGSKLCKAIVNHLIDKKVGQAITLRIFSERLKLAIDAILVDWRKKVETTFGNGSSLPEAIQELNFTFYGKSSSTKKTFTGMLTLVYPEEENSLT